MSSEKLKIVIDVDAETGKATINEVDRSLVRMERHTRKMEAGLKAAGAAFAGFISIQTARQFVEAFQRQEQAVAALDASLQSMGRTTPDLSRKLQALAAQIQQQGIIGDEEIIRGQSFLTTYSTISDELLPRVTRAMADLAAKTGGDVVSAANLLGKASMGMTGELARYGITLSEQAKKSKDFALILSEIEAQVGGMNAALANTASGAMKQFGNVAGDLQEKLGGMLAVGLLPVTKELTKMIGEMNDAVEAADGVKTKGQELSLMFAQVADMIGNAAKGIALPFEAVGGAIGAVAAQISFVIHGEFRKAMQAGAQWTEDFKQRLLDLTDPEIANRFELSARRMIEAANKLPKHAAAPAPTPAPLAPTPAAAGGPAAQAAETTQAIIAELQRRARLARQMTEAMVQGEEDVLLAQEDIQLARLEEQRQKDIERAQQKIQDKIALREALLAIDQDYDERRAQLGIQTAQRIEEIERRAAERRAAVEKQAQQAKLQLTGEMLGKMSALMNTRSRKLFELGKAAAIANAVVDTAQGVAKALGSAPPPLNFALAAAVGAAGAVQISRIASTKFGSQSAGVASAGGVPNVGGGPIGTRAGAGGLPTAPAAPQQAPQAPSINITVQALHPDALSPEVTQRIADSLAPALHDTLARGGQNVAVTA